LEYIATSSGKCVGEEDVQGFRFLDVGGGDKGVVRDARGVGAIVRGDSDDLPVGEYRACRANESGVGSGDIPVEEGDRVRDDGLKKPFVVRKKGSLPRGPNFERNKANRDRKKLKKTGVESVVSGVLGSDGLDVPEWRRKSKVLTVASSSGEKKGFFSECDDDVRRQLRDSRALALVAKNKLEAYKAERELKKVSSVSAEMELVQEMIKVTRLATQLKKNTADAQIGGWAATVADSLTKSVAEKAPSSVPSLESVGLGSSGLKSSDGDSARLAAYQLDIKYVDDAFELMDSYTDEEYEFAINRVKNDYPDVAFTAEERMKKRINEYVALDLLQKGMKTDDVQDVMDNINALVLSD